MTAVPPIITTELVKQLINTQFPQWKDLPVQPVKESGWDNHSFHLGDHMLVRLPSRTRYAEQVEKEQHWLPVLAPSLPLTIPKPLAMGQPSENYPWKWSIYQWIDGEAISAAPIVNLPDLAIRLAEFLSALQKINTKNGPLPGKHNFYRGGSLSVYDNETRQAIKQLKHDMNAQATIDIWEQALATTWHHPPVWVHGDISAGNLLLKSGKLSAVIDFGQLAIGDPACDLMIAWTLFDNKSREIFRNNLDLDTDTWKRARAWTLWKMLNYITNNTTSMNVEAKNAWHIIHAMISDVQN